MRLTLSVLKLRPRLRIWPLAGILLVSLLVPLLLNAYVSATTAARRYTDPAAVPTHQVAIVFGAGIRPDGRPSRILANRVDAAVELYRLGRVNKLLMTGDNSRPEYDEVTVMMNYAIAQGVPAADITRDYAGFSTYESCYRAREIFGVAEAVLVTQRFHLPRAVYTCEQFGIDVVGLGTADWGVFPDLLMLRYSLREWLATLNALWQVHISRPLPTFLGPYEGLS